MHRQGWIMEFLVIFFITLVVAVIVTLLWNLIAHGNAIIDWASSFRFAIIFGIVLPLANRVGKKHQKP
ncbi:MAG: hypothetical protein JW755_03810 [Candidatus Aminicenantes bacterium]|jgi:hypothetical protein|nr:hypothetical protein [Candidatus Aminicenantes bacterium]